MAQARQVLLQPVRVVASASWLYPFKGLWYFISHPFLWPLLKARLLPCILLSIFVLANLFIWTYLPQVAVMAIFHYPGGAWVNGTFLVLGEAAAIVAILFECFMVDETQVDIFDSVLVEKGFEDLVSGSRPVAPKGIFENDNPVKRLGKPYRAAVYQPFSFRQIIEFILCLPLNFIPIVGVPLFIFLTGHRSGLLQHHRYFVLRDMDRKERNAFLKQRRWKYTWFGTAALTLQLVPVLSMVFLLTTSCGSALWAAKLEEERRLLEGDTPQGQEYQDDPV
ncbi:hypothetical protein K490DRAFT_50835 [Saccharata proteae CBS 121410]|uniref:Outer spore wall protein RRT8 n=1 Tax=Saccharata proteae CBS 121410 TaxID=1314787 RepID=A0A9P4LU58_9PEZI|nr:hypothetical protein K490DRAFT_50835 [Saccharata proteae CBS 121410]